MPNEEIKRLFFGLKAVAPWPHDLPSGRIIAEENRHSTLAFLGETPYQKLRDVIPLLPLPPFRVGLTGYFNKCLFLPDKRHPRVVAWHVHWMHSGQELMDYQKRLLEFLHSHGFTPDVKRGFLPHVTLARPRFDQKEWKEAFQILPMITTQINLYESLGHSQYQAIWAYPLKAPFEEIEHTADIAFHIRGENLEQISQHAFIALAFKFPPLLSFLPDMKGIKDLNDTVIMLNDVVTLADQEYGCPFKAVSFHGDLTQEDDNILHWEMIVDV